MVAAAASLFLAWIGNEVRLGRTAALDAAVRNAVHGWASPPLTGAMKGATQLGSTPVFIGAGLLAVWRLAAAGRKRAAVLLAVSALGGEALVQTLKLLFQRPRPEAFFGYPVPPNYSFPSGHAAIACCLYGVLAAILAARLSSHFAKASLGALAVGLAALIGFSRVYLGVHYPSDVLGGYAAAAAWIAAVRAGYAVWRR
jgi:undecaprenyl-diphosphatase